MRTHLSKRVVTLPIEELKGIKRVVAVVSGSDRGAALSAAIRGSLINGLVIDEPGAASLLGRNL